MVEQRKPDKLLNKDFVLLIVISLITSFGYNMISTLVSSYAIDLGANLTVAGTIAGIFSISALCSRPFSGYATDIFNKKTMCVLSTSLIGVSMLGYIFAPTIGTYFFVRIIHGIAFGISGTANLALVSEYIPDRNMGEGLGYFGLGQVLAQVVGPSIGITVRDSYGYRVLFILIALCTLMAVVILSVFLKYRTGETTTEKRKPGNPRDKITFDSLIAKECLVYALIAGLFSLGNGIVNSFLIPVGSERGIHNIALFFSVNAIVLLLMRLSIGKVADRTKLITIVGVSLLFSALSMAITGFTSSFAIMMVAAALKAIGHGGGQISLQSACIKKVSPAKVGVATSTFYIGADIGQGLGPIIGGGISDRFGYAAMFYSVAAIMVASIIFFCVYETRHGKPTGVPA